MKLSRQSGGCQRNRTISRMTLDDSSVQPLHRSRPLWNSGMTPSHQNERSADSPKLSISSICKLVAICAALLVFAGGLFSKSFVDEYAYITQSYYTDLMLEGRFNDKAWLEFYAYDLQPLPKYLIGLSLHLARMELPARGDAFNWYVNYKSVGDYRMLAVARLPFVILGAIGCAAIFACGVLIKDSRVGAIAAAAHDVEPAVPAARPPCDVGCALRGPHDCVARGGALGRPTPLVRAIRCACRSRPCSGRDRRRSCPALQVQRLPGAHHHRELVHGRLRLARAEGRAEAGDRCRHRGDHHGRDSVLRRFQPLL